MTIRQNVPNGAPCWIDLMSSDTDKSRAFYGELLRAGRPTSRTRSSVATPTSGSRVRPWPGS